jgi:hypothetical protein
MVRRRGLEPPRGCPHQHLKLARLPVPPPPHAVFRFLDQAGFEFSIGSRLDPRPTRSDSVLRFHRLRIDSAAPKTRALAGARRPYQRRSLASPIRAPEGDRPDYSSAGTTGITISSRTFAEGSLSLSIWISSRSPAEAASSDVSPADSSLASRISSVKSSGFDASLPR